MNGSQRLRVTRISWEAQDVISLRLQRDDRGPLPAWTPGAHLELVLPSGLVRHYSLCGDLDDRSSYTLAVLRSEPSRGGSVEMHGTALVGRELEVRGPRNNFELQPAPSYVFVAGGIGITPLLSMMRAATERGVAWTLFYGGRTLGTMAFRAEIAEVAAEAGAATRFLPESDTGLLPLDRIVTGAGRGAAVYACGPAGMLGALEAATAARPDLSLHVELFTAPEAGSATGAEHSHDFVVELARSGASVTVTNGTTVLEAVQRVRPDVPYSCEEGYCGTCETTVLAGSPVHRDTVLGPAERGAGTSMMICVSSCASPRLVLDL